MRLAITMDSSNTGSHPIFIIRGNQIQETQSPFKESKHQEILFFLIPWVSSLQIQKSGGA